MAAARLSGSLGRSATWLCLCGRDDWHPAAAPAAHPGRPALPGGNGPPQAPRPGSHGRRRARPLVPGADPHGSQRHSRPPARKPHIKFMIMALAPLSVRHAYGTHRPASVRTARAPQPHRCFTHSPQPAAGTTWLKQSCAPVRTKLSTVPSRLGQPREPSGVCFGVTRPPGACGQPATASAPGGSYAPFPGVTPARHPGDPWVVRLSGPAWTVKVGCG